MTAALRPAVVAAVERLRVAQAELEHAYRRYPEDPGGLAGALRARLAAWDELLATGEVDGPWPGWLVRRAMRAAAIGDDVAARLLEEARR